MKYNKKVKPFEMVIGDEKPVRGFTLERGRKIFGNSKMTESINRNIMRKDLVPKDFMTDGKDLTFMVSKNNLPNDVVDRVEELLKTKPLTSNRCWFNSTRTHYEIDGVEKVDGWYGCKHDLMKPVMSTHFSFIEDLGDDICVMTPRYVWSDFGDDIKKKKDKPTTYDYEIWDYGTGIRWMRHSWNKYKGVSFDLTIELDERDIKSEWYYYKEIPTQKPPKVDTHFHRLILEGLLDWNSGTDRFVLNEKKLNN